MATWFENWYDRLMLPLEKRRLGAIRRSIIQQAQGKVLELGSGTGLNFPYYSGVEEVAAVEPSAAMREQSQERASKARVPITIVAAQGEQLPFADNTFDTAVVTLVLCSVTSPEQTLQELRRVCKPSGKILLFEHVRLAHPMLGKLQDVLTPAWRQAFDGCHLNREPIKLLEKAGLRVHNVTGVYKNLFLIVEAGSGKDS